MITERLTFRAKYGHGDELTALLHEWFPSMAKQSGIAAARVYADVTGPMFTVVTESDFADFAAYATFFSQDEAMYSDASFQSWFERMTAATESGERQLYRMESLI